jgi:hypothetical protein
MALFMNNTMKNYLINQGIITQLAGTSGTAGTASMNIYSGAQPASGDSAPTGILLATVNSISWGASTAGSSSLTGIISGTAGTAGTAGWARIKTVNSNGTFNLDGDVGTSGTNVFTIDTAALTAGEAIAIRTLNLVLPL